MSNNGFVADYPSKRAVEVPHSRGHLGDGVDADERRTQDQINLGDESSQVFYKSDLRLPFAQGAHEWGHR